MIMSIISDALKKAQNGRSENDPHPSDSTTPNLSLKNIVEDAKKSIPGRDPAKRSITALLLILALLVVAGAWLFVFYGKSDRPQPVVPPQKAVTPEKEAPKETPVAAVIKKAEETISKAVEKVHSVTSQIETASSQKTEETPTKVAKPKKYWNLPGMGRMPSLSGIMYSPDSPKAIINGVLTSEGEEIDGYTVKQILPDRIILSSDQGDFELRLR